MNHDAPHDEDPMAALDALLARPEPLDPSPHTLRRLAAGDLPAAEAAAARTALKGDSAAAERLAALEAEDAAFLAAHPFASVQDELRRRAAALPADAPAADGLFGRFLRPRSLFWALAAASTALLLTLFAPSERLSGDPDVPGNRLKGSITLDAWGELDGAATRLEPGATLQPGDRLQFRVTTTRSHLALLGVDGTGTVSRYQPVGGDLSTPFAPGQARPLPDALTLDDAPGPEVFVVFLSDQPLLVEDLEQRVHDAVDGGDPLALLAADWDDLSADVGTFWARKDLHAP